MKKFKFTMPMQIAAALILAVIAGLFAPAAADYTTWMGVLFLRALKMIVAPLVFTSLICGISSLEGGKDFGRLGFKTISLYLITSLVAILTGLFFVNILKPGEDANLGLTRDISEITVAEGSLRDNLIGIIPENIFKALVETDMLAIIFVSMLFGFVITRLKPSNRIVLDSFFQAANELIMKVTGLIIRVSPFGVFGIVIGIVAEQKNLDELVYRLGLYMLVVIIGLTVHSMITMNLMLRIIAKVNPLTHVKAMLTPLLTAFSTSSSSATLPLTMTTIEKNSGVSGKISSFTLPLGATINMDGTALYELVAAMFIAQAYGIELTLTQQVITVLTALLASVGAAGIPMAGMVMMSIVLTAVGLPLEGIGLILAVDRLLDMFRTAVNVWGDTVVCIIVAKSEGEKVYEATS